MEEYTKLSEMRDIIETAEHFLACKGDYHETITIIIENAMKISGADRVCLIMMSRKNELVIKAGLPRYAHGIEETLRPETGEIFLTQVMSNESVVVVANPSRDKRVSYMKDLVISCGISSILFLPLFSESEPLGILVFDWVGGRKVSKEASEKIKIFGRLAAQAILTVFKGRKDQEKILLDEKLRILGEHSSQVAHIIRNSLMVIGGFSERMLKCLEKESTLENSKIYGDMFRDVRESANIIDKETRKLERTVNDVLNYSSFSNPVLEAQSINAFLKEEILYLVSTGSRPILKLSKRLDGMKVAFDSRMLSICITDLVRYASESSASRIVIKTKLKPKQKEVMLSVIHNGKPIHPHIMKNIFSPFVTAEIDGTGLGLANVQSILRSHGGTIDVFSGETTEFRISLPLMKA
jgi:signal transduction histidine kinase